MRMRQSTATYHVIDGRRGQQWGDVEEGNNGPGRVHGWSLVRGRIEWYNESDL